MTTILAILGTVLGAVGTSLHVARFLWDRPRVVLSIHYGVYGGAISVLGPAPPLLGFKPGEDMVWIQVVKKGQGGTKVESAGITHRDGWWTPFLIVSDPGLSKLQQGDRLTFYGHASAIREAMGEHGGIKDYFCSTTEGEQHRRIPRSVRRGLEGDKPAKAPP
jgi:hypothetical protein